MKGRKEYAPYATIKLNHFCRINIFNIEGASRVKLNIPNNMVRINIEDEDVEFAGNDAGGGSMWNYKGQPFTGILEDFCENGNLIGEIECKNGYKDGLQTAFYENGLPKEEYHEKYNRCYGPYKYWDEEGILILHILFDNDGKEINRIVG